jgi:alkanesulfonate monooxygenase
LVHSTPEGLDDSGNVEVNRHPAGRSTTAGGSLDVFSVCPPVELVAPADYLRRVADVARWSEEAGCRGVLLHGDDGHVDPWLVAQVVLRNTEALSPLVAIQPASMHPYAAAKMVSSLAFLHHRRLYLHFHAGAVDDGRTTEYATIMKGLLGGPGVFSFDGHYYRVSNLKMTPPLPSELFPRIVISEPWPLAVKAAPVPSEPTSIATAIGNATAGLGIGVIAREDAAEAWRLAYERFPDDHQGPAAGNNLYWLHPFESYQTSYPYLVGSYLSVGAELRRLHLAGFGAVLVDLPPSRKELDHVGAVLEEASSGVA